MIWMCLLERVAPDRETYAYAEGKWSIREIVGHLIDGERVFGYRAFALLAANSRTCLDLIRMSTC